MNVSKMDLWRSMSGLLFSTCSIGRLTMLYFFCRERISRSSAREKGILLTGQHGSLSFDKSKKKMRGSRL